MEAPAQPAAGAPAAKNNSSAKLPDKLNSLMGKKKENNLGFGKC
jgi:hypothetical protein